VSEHELRPRRATPDDAAEIVRLRRLMFESMDVVDGRTMSTDLAWRRRGLARAVLTELLLEARRRGVRRVELHATPAGAPLYRAVGFASRAGGDEMRLDLAAGG
jgi:GNAT superfamily N-acetyltransferase